MKFEARSLGMFEILTVRQDVNEVFDADQMLQIVRSMLERDSLQIVIDVSALEYLYSDAINALVSINRRVLERGGHLSLLASQSKIREILLRSGLDSLFRIYKAEGELSVELVGQSPFLVEHQQLQGISCRIEGLRARSFGLIVHATRQHEASSLCPLALLVAEQVVADILY